MSNFQTDSLNPSALPSATLGRRLRGRRLNLVDAGDLSSSSAGPVITFSGAGSRPSVPGQRTEVELDRVAEEWNVRIDKEVKAVSSGLRELVELADIGKNPPHPSLTSLHLRLKTSSLIRSAQRLRDLSHELKLSLLLSDDVVTAARRDAEMREVRSLVGRRREEVVEAVKKLSSVGGSSGGGGGGGGGGGCGGVVREKGKGVETAEDVEMGEGEDKSGDGERVCKAEEGIMDSDDESEEHDEKNKLTFTTDTAPLPQQQTDSTSASHVPQPTSSRSESPRSPLQSIPPPSTSISPLTSTAMTVSSESVQVKQEKHEGIQSGSGVGVGAGGRSIGSEIAGGAGLVKVEKKIGIVDYDDDDDEDDEDDDFEEIGA